MAIFSRRILQRLIDENASFLSKAQTRNHVQHLNRMPEEKTLAYEWEVVLFNAFSKVGKVFYHKNFGGKRNADMYFETFENPKNNFVADITTVSDKGLDENNPFKALQDNLYEIVRKHGLRPNSFNVQVGNHRGPVLSKIKLKLPGRARFPEIIFGKEFTNFIEQILKNPNQPHSFGINNVDTDVTISYNPKQRFASGAHPSYAVVYSLTENTIYQALARKVPQLKGTNFNGPLGIFLCDGGSSLFGGNPVGQSYSIEKIIQKFLADNPEISFVVTLTTRRKHQFTSFIRVVPLDQNPYLPVINLFGGLKFNKVGFNLSRILEKVVEVFPKIESDPINALNFLKGRNPNIGRSKWGGMEVKPGNETTKVKISARGLLDLLAGRVGQKEFFEHHGFIVSDVRPGHPMNPFQIAISRGQLIEKISIEKMDSDDDDWALFELRGPDSAISPFRVPFVG